MTTKSIAAVLAALSALAVVSAAHAACSDRPGTPNRVKAEPYVRSPGDTILFTWFDTTRADERVWHDIEVTDGKGRLVQSIAGEGHGAMTGSKQQTERFFRGLAPNTTRCFRVKARDEAGTQGCVSKLWSARVCATTASAPGAPPPGKPAPGTPPGTPGSGKWGALAADGKGHWGFAVNYPTQWRAQYEARKGCGDPGCTVRISAQMGCYAYFESRSGGYWYGLALHSSGATALQVARSGCEKGAPAGTCKLVKANCGS